MKNVSEKFVKEITSYGRMLDTIITYTINGKECFLDSDTLFSVTPHFEGNILKSVMKQLDIESSVAIPKDTVINVKFGVQVDLSLTVAEVHAMKVNRLNEIPVSLLSSGLKGFEYIDLGNYIVSKDAEYNADTMSYSHTCYDKMLLSMKNYEDMKITFPIKVKDYIKKLCDYIGLTFASYNDNFANCDKELTADYYIGYDYTFRDVLDELAQVTASTICINSNDELEIRYIPKKSAIELNEDYFKDTNVTFDNLYGPINSIVLSRSGESDNIYLQDEESIENNGLCELKIVDNQIMNYNNRSDYLPGILEKLNGLTYCTNNFDSTGICFLDLCDRYTANVHDKLYDCVLFNDEIKITQGLEETIYTEMPTETKTDYTKADKTDQKINKAYIIMDKVNKKLESVISEVGKTSKKVTKIEQTVDSISQKVSDIEDLTRTAEEIKTVTLENCIEANLLELHIYGNNTVFNYLLLDDKLTLDDDLHLEGDDLISVTDKDNNIKTYSLGITEALRQNSEVCDEVVLENGQAKVIRRVNKSGSTKAKESVEDLGKLEIPLKEGTNTITINNYTARIKAKYVIKSTYSDTFASRVEMNSAITQNSEKIMSEVNKKVDETELGTKIEQNAEAVKFAWNQISEFIQMMIIDGNASLAILDKNKKVLMALDKIGQHFYNSDKTMDIGAFDCYFPSYDNTYKSLMFALNEKATNNFMAWGYKTTAENGDITYTPVVYLGGNSDADYGFHVENDIILNFNKIRLKKSKIYDNNDSLCFEIGEDLFYGDTRDNKEIFSVYNNSAGTKTFRFFGDDSNPITIDSSGNLALANGKIILDNNGNIDCVHLYQTGDSSDMRIKNNIKDSSESAINIINKIHHKEFDKKDDNTHYKIGYIAQEMEQIDKNFVVKKQANKEKRIEERYYINQLPILATVTKAIQELHAQIGNMQKEIENLKGEKNG